MRKTIFVMVILSLFVIPMMPAIGVANSYWDDKPLKLSPGESTIISLRLQNEETTPIMMEVKLNSEIASLLVDGTTYEVPADKASLPVYIKVSIPKNAEVGTKYTIIASFKKVSGGEGGAVSVAQGITSKVPVEVVSSGESELYGAKTNVNYLLILGILVAIAMGFLVYFFYSKKNASKKTNKL